ncbi:MAG TPA: hypothetical protein VFN35_23965, partial [Ktedonobacteraceae bacterium]|nr:hypothetical protein [Ktedonobacteraceae bacterium]
YPIHQGQPRAFVGCRRAETCGGNEHRAVFSAPSGGKRAPKLLKATLVLNLPPFSIFMIALA